MSAATRNRVVLLIVAVALISGGVVFRLYQLQFVSSPELRKRAQVQHLREKCIEGRRGAILDRNHREMAVSVECGSLYARPARVSNKEQAARLLSEILGTGKSNILRKLRSDSSLVYLQRGLSPETMQALFKANLFAGDQPAFGLDIEGTRHYPAGRLASHVIGFAGIGQKGLSGIEKARHEQLQGDPTYFVSFRDGQGDGFVSEVRSPEKHHMDVVLAIDAVLQHVVERELQRAIRKTEAKAAWAVLLDPRTGEVLALANRPAPDLNRYKRSSFDVQRNRALLHLYEPGSTFKVITAAAVLERGRVSPGRRFDCENGRLKIEDRTYTDHEPFGTLSFREIIEHSSNVGMIKISHLLSGEELLETIRKFGFDGVSHVGLSEAAGRLPDLSGEPIVGRSSLAIGYGLSVTALQMASAVSAVANGGVLVPPRIVLGAHDPDGTWHPEPAPEPRRVISRKTAATLTGMLEGVVLRGTGRNAAVPGYRVAGKTGTSRKYLENIGYSNKQYYASFVGFAPSRNPRLVCMVVIDSPRGIHNYYGGQAAAPAFARIMTDALAALRVPPDNGGGVLTVDLDQDHRSTDSTVADTVPAVAQDTGLVPDVSGLSLRKALATMASYGYQVEVRGNGRVVSQSPPAGSLLNTGGTCKIRLALKEIS